jgi:hypothetical protein
MGKTHFLEHRMAQICIAEVAFQKFTFHEILIVQIPAGKITTHKNAAFVFPLWETFFTVINTFECLVCNKRVVHFFIWINVTT